MSFSGRIATVAAGCACFHWFAVPRATTQYTYFALTSARRCIPIAQCTAVIVATAILNPLPNITAHVVQTLGIGLLARYGMGIFHAAVAAVTIDHNLINDHEKHIKTHGSVLAKRMPIYEERYSEPAQMRAADRNNLLSCPHAPPRIGCLSHLPILSTLPSSGALP